ncbi:MAG: hypothetical protein K2Q01_03580 [Rickettsiales bacterium]|nr:hypothetical protein [Rickettsiales bacterium]
MSKLSPQEQDGIVALLTRIYTDLHAIETEHHLLAGENDFRPRIEHFHDAIRAFSSQNPEHQEPGGRLSVELLAYDLSCLRFLQTMPLASFKPHGTVYSPSVTPVAVGEKDLMVRAKRPSRQVRERICELYQHYAVLFAALLKPLADRDYIDRVDDLNQDVKDLHGLIAQLDALLKGKGSLEKVMAAIQHLEEEGLRHELLQFMQAQKHSKKDNLVKLMGFLKEHVTRKDKEIAGIDAAHMNYVLAQLGIFEGSRDMLKKMAAQGMNLVGKFVENAMASANRDLGR